MLAEELVEQDEEFSLPAKSIRFHFDVCMKDLLKDSPALRHDGHFWGALDRDCCGFGVAGLRLRQRLGHRVQEVDEPRLPARGLA